MKTTTPKLNITEMISSIHIAIREQAIEIQSLKNEIVLLKQHNDTMQNQIYYFEVAEDDGTIY